MPLKALCIFVFKRDHFSWSASRAVHVSQCCNLLIWGETSPHPILLPGSSHVNTLLCYQPRGNVKHIEGHRLELWRARGSDLRRRWTRHIFQCFLKKNDLIVRLAADTLCVRGKGPREFRVQSFRLPNFKQYQNQDLIFTHFLSFSVSDYRCKYHSV